MYKTTDFLNPGAKFTKSNFINISDGVLPSCVRKSFESAFPESITYFRDFSVYRTYINSKGIIQNTLLFTIQNTTVNASTSIDDLVVLDKYAGIKFTNNSF